MCKKKQSILLIEDNPGDSRLIKEMIKDITSFNYELIIAETLKEGCELIKKYTPILVLLDLNMPDSNGKETFDTVKKLAIDIPIVLVSGLQDVDLSLSLIQDGAQDYILKQDLNNILLEKTIQYAIMRKQAEKKLKETHENLERANIEKEKQKAELAISENTVKAKQEFLSTMSHEIRTPMNAIIGFTKVLLKTDLTPNQKEYLNAIKLSGNSLITLINDILDLSKVDAGKMTFEQIAFDISSSISSMLYMFEIKIQEKNLKLISKYDNNIPNIIEGDPMRLHQIIINLMSNAVKFTADGEITLSAKLISEDDIKVTIEFSVSDTGIGIDTLQKELIFDDFQQASSSNSRLYGGTGLGLAIVKKLVDAQGGNINVKSELGKGSSFIFQLPFLKSKTTINEQTEILEIDKKDKKIKILVVEDIPLNQLLIKTLLDEFGFTHEMASNGKIAVEKLQESKYDIVLMDLQMPEMDGFEATKYIRNELKLTTPIIALTADAFSINSEKCIAIGMSDCIAKPIDERLLYTKIIDLVDAPLASNNNENIETHKSSCINLEYLISRTKSNPKLILEMIAAYLEQTPPLIVSMKQSILNEDWDLLYASVHKLIPSFLIMGIHTDYEIIAKEVQEYASKKEQLDKIPSLASQVIDICSQACDELEKEYNTIKNNNS